MGNFNYRCAISHRKFAMVIMRVIARANAGRKVEEVMGDRCISRKFKGNVLSSCVTPAYMNVIEMTLKEK